MFQSPSGGYADFIVDDDGEAKLMRQDDGFHLNLDGANKLARAIEAEIEKEITARGGQLLTLTACGRAPTMAAAAAGHLVLVEAGALPGAGVGGLHLPAFVHGRGDDRGVGGADLAHAGLVVGDDVARDAAGEREQLVVGARRGSRGRTGSASSASRKLPVKLISRARRTPMACGQQHGEAPARHDADAGVGVAEAGPLARRRGSRSSAPARTRR